jgi:hypothetical protein
MNGDSIFYSRKAAKLAKKNNEINLIKNLRVFARDLFDSGLSGLGGLLTTRFQHSALSQIQQGGNYV